MNKVYLVIKVVNNSGKSLSIKEFFRAFSTELKATDYIDACNLELAQEDILPDEYIIREVLYD